MAFWDEGGFFQSMKGHLIKWWQIVIMPVFRINNNTGGVSGTVDETMNTEASVNNMPDNLKEEESFSERESVSAMEEKSQPKDTDETEDILERLQREKEAEAERKRKEIEVMRKKAQEEERIAAIMNANKVAVDDFIAEGKANRELQEEDAAELTKKEEEEERKQEELRRAQEIIDRLNREAAEDEAKKQAEIAAAKEEAKGKFG